MKHRDLDRKRREHKRKWRRLRAKSDDAEITRQYTQTELEAMSQPSGTSNGILRLGTGELILPPGIESFDESQPSKSPPRVMLVIVTLALLFIAVIAYFVSQMPKKD